MESYSPKSSSRLPLPLDPKNKTGGIWGRDLAGIYRLAHFIQKYRLHLIFQYISPSWIHAAAIVFDRFFFKNNPNFDHRLKTAYDILYPKRFSPSNLSQLAVYTHRNFSILLFESIFRTPNMKTSNLDQYVQFSGLNYLDSALLQGKGAILISVHIGNFFHLLTGLLLHPRKYPIVVIANLKNQLLYDQIIRRPEFTNLHIVGTTKYAELKDILIHHLNKNRIIFIMHDFGSQEQLRVPFLPNHYLFLCHIPQSAIALAKSTGAALLPVIATPHGGLDRTDIELLDPTAIVTKFTALAHITGKEFHGQMSIVLNQVLFPHVVRYLPFFEEIQNLVGNRLGDRINFPPNTSMKDFTQIIYQKCLKILEDSYESNRPDAQWITEINAKFPEIIEQILSPNAILQPQKAKIILNAYSGTQELQLLRKILINEFKKKQEFEIARAVESLFQRLFEITQ